MSGSSSSSTNNDINNSDNDMVDNAFELYLKQVEEAKGQKRPNQKINIEEESKFVRFLVVTEYYYENEGILPDRDEYGRKISKIESASIILSKLESTHLCDRSCKMIFLPKGYPYKIENEIWISSSNALCCTETGKIHLCGEDYCNDALLTPKGEGLTCPISGRVLANVLSLANDRTQEDIRIAGRFQFRKFPRSMDDVRDDKSLHDRLTKISRSRDDVTYILSQHTNKNFNELKVLCIERSNRRQHAYSVWEVKVLSQNYKKQLVEKIAQAEKIWKQHVIKYYNNCAKKNQKADFWRIERLFYKYVFPECKGSYCGIIDPQKINSKKKNYYIECMLRIWEKLSTLDYAKKENIKFSDCAVAILNALSSGLQIVVYTKKNSDKPYRRSSMTDTELKNAIPRKIVFVDKHDYLMLAPTSIVRKNNPPKTTRNTNYLNNLSNGRRGYGCKTISKTTRKQRRIAPVIVSDKVLKQLYSSAISASNSVNELKKYVLANLIDVQNNENY